MWQTKIKINGANHNKCCHHIWLRNEEMRMMNLHLIRSLILSRNFSISSFWLDDISRPKATNRLIYQYQSINCLLPFSSTFNRLIRNFVYGIIKVPFLSTFSPMLSSIDCIQSKTENFLISVHHWMKWTDMAKTALFPKRIQIYNCVHFIVVIITRNHVLCVRPHIM